MLEFSGKERFEQDADRVFAVVTDLGLLAQNIPDLVSYELVSDQRLKCVVRPGFSFLRMTMKTEIDLIGDPAARSADLRVRSQGIGASMEIESRLQVAEAGPGSVLNWSARVVKTTGLVATVSPDLVRAAAEQVIRAGWQRVRERLAAG
jgi:carbon monoxide dehydrogenase subunit G